MATQDEPTSAVERQRARAAARLRVIDAVYPDLLGRPDVDEVVTPLRDAGWTEDDIRLWVGSPTGWLDGRIPVEILDSDRRAVAEAVQQVALGPGS